MTRSSDGTFLFSSSQLRSLVTDAAISKLAISPTPPTLPDAVPTLASLPSTVSHTRIPCTPVTALHYGVFCSFAPAFDGASASVSELESGVGCTVKIETVDIVEGGVFNGSFNSSYPTLTLSPDLHTPRVPNLNPTELKKLADFNWDAILDIPLKVERGEGVQMLIDENKGLISELVELQDRR